MFVVLDESNQYTFYDYWDFWMDYTKYRSVWIVPGTITYDLCGRMR